MIKYLDIDEEYRDAFQHELRMHNLASVRILSIISVFFFFASMLLDYFRYKDGLMDERPIYNLLAVNHTMFAMMVIPLLIIHNNKTLIRQGKFEWADEVISLSVITLSLTLLLMAVLTLKDRGELTLYAVYIFINNFIILFSHRMLVLFNTLSLLFICAAILFIFQGDRVSILLKIFMAIGISLPAFIIAARRYNERLLQFTTERQLEATNLEIEKQKAATEKLLLNILPESIADELQEKGKVEPKYFENVSIMFADFAGFTSKTEFMPHYKLVEALNFYFSYFDDVVQRHQLEKIKTIGDGYMVVGGLTNDSGHCNRMILAASEMLAFVEQVKTDRKRHNGSFFDLRIGIHCGPVVGGVVGKSKFSFDIWGSTVNIAARMEEAGEAGRINLSQAAFELSNVKATFRGKIDAKGLGEIPMYFVVETPGRDDPDQGGLPGRQGELGRRG